MTALTVKVISILSSESEVVLTLAPTEWAIDNPDNDSSDEIALVDAEPGQPGAWWMVLGGPQIVLHLPRWNRVTFEVGHHYTITLDEIVDAPMMEFEPA